MTQHPSSLLAPNRQNQLILLDTLDQEVTKFRDCNTLLDLNSLVCLCGIRLSLLPMLLLFVLRHTILIQFYHLKFTEAKVYHNKLVTIRKEMIMLHEKTTKLKVC